MHTHTRKSSIFTQVDVGVVVLAVFCRSCSRVASVTWFPMTGITRAFSLPRIHTHPSPGLCLPPRSLSSSLCRSFSIQQPHKVNLTCFSRSFIPPPHACVWQQLEITAQNLPQEMQHAVSPADVWAAWHRFLECVSQSCFSHTLHPPLSCFTLIHIVLACVSAVFLAISLYLFLPHFVFRKCCIPRFLSHPFLPLSSLVHPHILTLLMQILL